MKLPGLAWLDLRVGRDPVGRTLFQQRALFHPKGLAGQAYWAAISPFHDVVFGGMQENVKEAAEALARANAAGAADAPATVDVRPEATLVR